MNIPPGGSSKIIPFSQAQPAANAKRSRLFYIGLAGLIAGGICCLLSVVALILSVVLNRKAAPAPLNLPVKSPTGTVLPAASLPAGPESTPSLSAGPATPSLPGSGGNATSFSDDFSNPNGGWYVGSTNDFEAGYVQGGYSMSVKTANRYFISTLPDPFPTPIRDIIIGVRAKPAPGGPAEIGVVCRFQDSDNYYLSAIQGDQFYIGKMVNGTWTYLTSPERQPLINFTPAQDGYLAIGMSCISAFIVLEVNGVGQAHEADDAFTAGDIGLYVGGGDQKAQTGDYARVDFEEFKASLPQQ